MPEEAGEAPHKVYIVRTVVFKIFILTPGYMRSCVHARPPHHCASSQESHGPHASFERECIGTAPDLGPITLK